MVPSTLYCDTCGAANRQEAKFCFSCGEPLHTGTATLQTPASGANTNISTTTENLPTQGTLLRQRYHILCPLGQGGFGAVYKAEDTEFGNRLVAIKEMSQKGLNAQEIIEATDAFKREALLLAGLMHPNLPRIYDHFTEGGHWYLVMDYIDGETLEDRLNKVGVSIKVKEALDIGIKLCAVLDYLHNRQPPIIFRDLKPANIMLAKDESLYLIDFGIARHFKPGQAKDTIAFGSPGYAAPEQYGQAQTTPRSDIYSLGAILHQLLSGDDPSQTPFRFKPLSLSNQPIPAALETLIMRMVEIDESKRPAGMAAVKQELEYIATHPDTLQPSPGSSLVQFAQGLKHQGIIISTYQGHTSGYYNWITAVAWSPGGTQIVSASAMGEVKVWEATTGNPLYAYRGHTDKVSVVAWSPDGTRIASASKDRTAQVWDATTGKTYVTYRGHASEVYSIAWSPDGQYLTSGGGNRAVYVWDANTGLPHLIYREHHDIVYAVAWSPTGQQIASAGADRTVQVWEATTGRKLLTYRGHSDYVRTLSWPPDGRRIASVGYDGSVQVWAATTGDNIGSYSGHSKQSLALPWSPDGQYLATTGKGTVQVWDVTNWSTVYTCSSPPGGIIAMAWLPGGLFAASASADNTVQVWQAM